MVLNVKISSATLIWAAFIIISASFMRSVLNFLVKNMAMTGVSVLLWVVFAIGLAVIVFYLSKQKIKVWDQVLFSVIFVIGLIYASQMPIVEERWHIIQFGLLGWLIARDSEGITNGLGRLVFSALFGLLVASLDETFQFYLPNRTADVRDIISGTVGSIWGAMLYLSCRKNIKEDTKYA
jgi:ABC-type uncharacterized transport system involved in gliding motility auxiliary subunit